MKTHDQKEPTIWGLLWRLSIELLPNAKIFPKMCSECDKIVWPWEYCFKHRPGFLAISDFHSHPKCLLTEEAYKEFCENPEKFREMLV